MANLLASFIDFTKFDRNIFTLRVILFSLLLFFSAVALSQGSWVPLGSDAYYYMDRADIKYGKILPVNHTGDKGFYRGKIAKTAETLFLSNLRFNKTQQYQLQWLVDESADFLDSLQSRTRKPLLKVFYREPASFLHYSSKNKGLFDLRVNPVFSMNLGVESYSNRFVFNSERGVEVRGNIKRVFSFYFSVQGNAARPLHYVTNRIKENSQDNPWANVPGQSYWKDYSSKIFKFNDGIDYFDARGVVNVNVLKYINISIGRDKFFIGNGQRSMFLSDFSAPYLFLKMDIEYWRVKYQSILAELTSQYNRGTDKLLPKKYMAVHHLSIQAAHFLNLGLFEGVILKRSDHFELQYLNPIIFYRAVEHAIGSPDNVLIGGDIKINIINHISIYYQVVLDEFNFKHAFKGTGWWANKWAMQFGFKYIDIAPNLDGQFEFNISRPFTYTHESGINYTHYNQPLAHPLGANFYEIILQLHYEPIPKLALNAKFVTARVGDDTLDANGVLTNLGGNILTSSGGGSTVTQEFGNKIGQGAKGTITYFQFLASYQPWHNIYFEGQLLYRAKSSTKPQNLNSIPGLFNESTFAFMVGLRWNIAARRYEF